MRSSLPNDVRRQSGEQGAERRRENAGADGDVERIVDEREEQVPADVAHGGATEMPGARDSSQ